MTLHKVFVYGTLKTGEPNHHAFSQDSMGYKKLICVATTSEKYPLIVATKYNIPFLLYEPGTGENVEGELYEIDDKVLAVLDELEDHPNFYVRDEKEVISMEDSTVHKAWIYFIKNFQKKLLTNQMIKSYSKDGPYPKYIERYLRKGTSFKRNEVLNTDKPFVSREEATLQDLNDS